MKLTSSKTLLALILTLPMTMNAQKFYLLGGSQTNKIAVVDAKKEKIIWEHQLGKNEECNTVRYTTDGNIAYSYKLGAKLIDKDKKVIWEHKRQNKNEEVQSIQEIEDGYLLGICGHPLRIVELDKNGNQKCQIKFETGIEDPHLQTRQITKTKKGNYLVPLMGTGNVLEVNPKGEVVRDVKFSSMPFSVKETKSGTWIVPSGFDGKVYEYNPKTNTKTLLLDDDALSEVDVQFAAEVDEVGKGKYVVCNWLGDHGDKKQPILLFINEKGEITNTLKNKFKDFETISSIELLNDF